MVHPLNFLLLVKVSEGTTQGDLLAVAMYALAVTPLIDSLHHHHQNVSQAWFADDATAAGQLIATYAMVEAINFSLWAHSMVTIIMLQKHTLLSSHSSMTWQNSYLRTLMFKYTCHGQCHLGAAIGTQLYIY